MNLFSSVISQKQKQKNWMTDAKLYKYLTEILQQNRKKSCRSLGILLYLCCQILNKADKIEACKYFINIMWICYSYTTTAMTFLMFYYYFII